MRACVRAWWLMGEHVTTEDGALLITIVPFYSFFIYENTIAFSEIFMFDKAFKFKKKKHFG